jgi:hypothetical protein
MPTVTLVESAKLAQNELVAGVIENVITVNKMYEVLPFDGINGNALAYNRENALAPVAMTGVGDADGTIGAGASGTNEAARQAAKNPATFTQVTSALTTILGDAEVNGLIQATRSSDGNDQTAVQIASKAKSAGRQYQDMFINGTGSNFEFDGLINLVPAGQKVTPETNGRTFDLDLLDELLDMVVDKDGQVDWITMHSSILRVYYARLRALGGANISEVVTLPSGAQVPGYRGTPIFRNDYIPTDQTQGTADNCTTIFAGNFDDGSRTHGLVGLTAEQAAGIQVVDVGESETKDDRIWRVKWYCGLALFSEKGVASAAGILPGT